MFSTVYPAIRSVSQSGLGPVPCELRSVLAIDLRMEVSVAGAMSFGCSGSVAKRLRIPLSGSEMNVLVSGRRCDRNPDPTSWSTMG